MKKDIYLELKKEKAVFLVKVLSAETLLERIQGLIGRKLEEDSTLLIKKCWAIHTFFMTYPIDVLFVDKDFKVLKTVENLLPFKTAICVGAYGVLEFKAGRLKHLPVKLGSPVNLINETQVYGEKQT